MGILGSIIKAPFRLGKKAVSAIIPEGDSPIESVAKINGNYEAFRQYYETLGNDVSSFKNYAVVWKKGVGDKQKIKVLSELKELGI